MEDKTLTLRGKLVSGLQSVVLAGTRGIDHVPGFIKKVIREKTWKKYIVEATGQIVEYDSFQAFVEDSPPDGLGSDLKTIKRLCRYDEEASQIIRQITTAPALVSQPLIVAQTPAPGELDGTHRVGTLEASEEELIALFGPPHERTTGGKTSMEWHLKFGDTVATIYDYKGRRWSIGGHHTAARDVVQAAIRTARRLRPSA